VLDSQQNEDKNPLFIPVIQNPMTQMIKKFELPLFHHISVFQAFTVVQNMHSTVHVYI
jgi:hypothetical protein